MAICTCVENSSGAVLKALAACTPKCRPRDDPRPPIPAGIQDEKPEEPAAEAVADHKIPHSESLVNSLQRSVARRLIEGKHDQCSATLESLDTEDQSL